MPANFKAELLACFGQPVSENPQGKCRKPPSANLVELALSDRRGASSTAADAMLGVRAFGCAAEPDDPAQNR